MGDDVNCKEKNVRFFCNSIFWREKIFYIHTYRSIDYNLVINPIMYCKQNWAKCLDDNKYTLDEKKNKFQSIISMRWIEFAMEIHRYIRQWPKLLSNSDLCSHHNQSFWHIYTTRLTIHFVFCKIRYNNELQT